LRVSLGIASALAVLLGVVLWVGFLSPRGAEAPASEPPLESPSLETENAVAPLLPGESVEAVRRDEVATLAPEVTAPALAERQVVLHGYVEGLPAWHTSDARIEVRPIRPDGREARFEVVGFVAPDRTFRIDLAPLVRAEPRMIRLKVRAAHPLYSPAEEDAPAPRPSEIDPQGPAESRVAIELVPACVVEGRIRENGGPPVEAAVGLFAIGARGPSGAPLATAVSDRGGRYRLALREEGRYFLVVSAPGFAPAAEEISLVPAHATAPATILLEKGRVLRGFLRFAGPRGTRARIAATRRDRGGEFLALGDSRILAKEDGTFVKEAEIVVTEGPYEIGGLDAAVYTVRVLPAAWRRPSFRHLAEDTGDVFFHPALVLPWTREVLVPADGVDFEVAFGTLCLKILGRGRPLADATVVLAQRELPVNLPREGPCVALVPEEPCEVRASRPGYHERTFEFPAPGPGEIREEILELFPKLPHPSLVLALRDPEGNPVRRADCAVLHEGDPFRRDLRRIDDPGGTLRVADLDPGPIRVVVRPLGDGDEASYFLDETVDVEIPEEGEAKRSLRLRVGGRIRLSARDSEGNPVPSWVEIRNADTGARIDADLSRDARWGPRNQWHDGNAILQPALPAGLYSVTLRPTGFRDRTLEARVEARRTTTIETTLELDR